jgi:HAD superfamily hydrolase (TIGR01509 family)
MKVILFDIIGVLITNLPTGSKVALNKLYNLLEDPPISFEEYFKRYQLFKIGGITRNEFWLGINNFDTIETNYLNSYQVTKSTISVLEKMRSKYILAAVSNHPAPWMNCIIDKYQLNNYFQKIYISGDTRKTKSDISLFIQITTDLKVNPSECAIVDDQNKNLIVASKCGLKTIHLDRNNDSYKFKSDYKIISLEELINIKL